MSQIVVAGAGQAAASLAETLRREGFDGDITLIGREPVPPYQRPPLSKAYLLGEMSRERLFLRPDAWYEEKGIKLILGAEATGIDTAARTVKAGDLTIGWDDLVIATGLAPRRLPQGVGGGLDGVHTIRTLGDIDALRAELGSARRLLVVGGGYIGLEAAAVARKLGVGVTLVEAGLRILGRVAAPETADWFRDLHTAQGVEVREDAALAALTGDGRVGGAVLETGEEIACDMVIAGIGLDPACPLAEAAGIETDGGMVVDAMGQTSAKRIWAAGDCAAQTIDGRRLRLESVQNAVDMGAAVARNILGAAAPYVPQPWFWSDQYDAHLQIAGLGAGHDHVVVRGGDGARSHWYYAGGTLLAVDAINDARAYMVGKRLLSMGRSPDPAAVADGGTDLKTLLTP